MPSRKLSLGWFSFSCSGDNTIIFTELLNDHWADWKKLFDFRHVGFLQTQNKFDHFDLAFVEGAIASREHIKRIKEIRARSKKLIAVGSCAVLGQPAGQRNFFSPEQKERCAKLIKLFSALPKVLKASEVVKVDAEVPGCPMDEKKFLEVVKKITLELLPPHPALSRHEERE